ncbi:PAS domain-containing protein [Candidatus Margulisiibacteriota bacterium]
MVKISDREYKDLKDAREFADSVIDTVHDPLIILDGAQKVVQANRSFYRDFRVTPEETEKQFIFDLGNRQWNIPKLRKLLGEILPKRSEFNDFEVEHEFPQIGKRVMLLNARRIPPPPENMRMILLAIRDITVRRLVEDKLAEYSKHLEETVKSRTIDLEKKSR